MQRRGQADAGTSEQKRLAAHLNTEDITLMDRITPLDRQDAAPEAAAVYEEIQQAFGMVPNLFKTYAHFPPLLRANWDKTKALMLGGSLPRPLKECIAVVVSQANSCRYCVAAHSAMLKQLGFTDERIQAIQGDLDAAGLSRRDAAILSFARRATLSPLDITDADVEELGLTEAETVEVLGVMELFTSYNKFVDALAVTIDF